jgi:F-type H+-transporting ATPase subunit epsilon
MRLMITTPSAVVVDHSDVVAVRAEDETGSFGILDGHADFLTALTVSVVSWRRLEGHHGYCAVRQGILFVSRSTQVAIASREAIVGNDLEHLENVIVATFRDQVETERIARLDGLRLEMRAIRQIVKYLRPDGSRALGEGI